jgi:uncharacterized protein YecE (DUF72 family)
MARILVGTSGYAYNEWVGPVYPEGSRPDEFLPLYSQLFPTVELNFSYYKMPTAYQLSHLLKEAGPELVFSIKANETLTHKVEPEAWRESAGQFLHAIEPLLEADRLGAVLFQFPFSFHYEPERRRYLDALLKEFKSIPLAVEFRNSDWYNNRVVDAFRARNIAIASVDLPELKGLPPVMDVVTAPLAYIRFHGRNGETWWGSDAASRYDYLYSDVELEAWGGRVKAMAERADRILVYFNNHMRGQAPRNAKTFSDILRRDGLLP